MSAPHGVADFDYALPPDRIAQHPLSERDAARMMVLDRRSGARLLMRVDENAPFRPGYELKLNSYDLGVDIELQDVIQRLRFEHPEVRCVVISGGIDRVFCAGANIHMLASSAHGCKVNFCKFTNETRLGITISRQFSCVCSRSIIDLVTSSSSRDLRVIFSMC